MCSESVGLDTELEKELIVQFEYSMASELGRGWEKLDLQNYCCDGAGGRQGLHFVFTPERKWMEQFSSNTSNNGEGG